MDRQNEIWIWRRIQIGRVAVKQNHLLSDRQKEFEGRTYLALVIEVFKELSCDFHENDLVIDSGGELVVRVDVIVVLLAGFDAKQGLPLDGFGVGRSIYRERNIVARKHRDEQERARVFEVTDPTSTQI